MIIKTLTRGPLPALTRAPLPTSIPPAAPVDAIEDTDDDYSYVAHNVNLSIRSLCTIVQIVKASDVVVIGACSSKRLM